METKLTRLMYGWSKWGGARYGLERENTKEWYCQACGDKQIDILPSYMFNLEMDDERNFFRVCSKCKHKAIIKELKTILDLMKHIKAELQTY